MSDDIQDATADLLERVAATAAATNSAPQAIPQGASHNNYSLYVNRPDDLIGLVAYSLYKQHKISFFNSEIARTGQVATAEKTQTFCDVYSESHQVELLRERANVLLEKMTEEVLDEAVLGLNKDYEKRLKEELKAGQPLRKSIGHSVAGNLVTGFVIATIVWMSTFSFDDLLAAGKKLLSSNKTEQVDAAPAAHSKK